MDRCPNRATVSRTAWAKPKRPGSPLVADSRPRPPAGQPSRGRSLAVDHSASQSDQPCFNSGLASSDPGACQGATAGFSDAGSGLSNQAPTPSHAALLIDREPAPTADASTHRQCGIGGRNHVRHLALDPPGSASQMLYCTPSPAQIVPTPTGLLVPNALGQTWPVPPSYYELACGVLSPLSPFSGQTYGGVQSATAYKPPTQELSSRDPGRRVHFTPNSRIQPSDPPSASTFTLAQPVFLDFAVHYTPVSSQTPFHDRETSVLQPRSNLAGSFDQNISRNWPPLTFPHPGPQPFFAADSYFEHRDPFNPMSSQHQEPNSYRRYVNIIPVSDCQGTVPAPPGDLSDVDEILLVDRCQDNVAGGVPVDPNHPSQENPFGSPSQNSSVVDLSSSGDALPETARPQGSPPRDFVNLSLRDGQLYDDKKRVDVTDIIAHSFEEPSGRKQRGQLSREKREAAGRTRKMRACFRCHSQRICCLANPDRPDDPKAPCATCLKVTTTKKVIHRLTCVRLNVTSVVLYRSGGLNLTRRWEGTMVRDVGDWAGQPDRVIQMSLGLSRTPMTLRVRKFIPRDGDVLVRRWVDNNGAPKMQELPPYALADARQTADEFRIYLRDHAFDGLTEAVKGSDELIRRTYNTVFAHYSSLPEEVEDKKTKQKKPNEEKKLLADLIKFVFSIRHMTGSAWISGEETLDMEPNCDPSYPLRDKLSLPRMIIAQIDSIQCELILKKTAPSVLRQLLNFIYRNNPSNWFTIYLVIFMLLHEISHSTKDRHRHAQQNLAKTRYGLLGHFVEQMQEGANVFLAVWQYYKCVDLMKINWDDRANTRLKHMTAEQAKFVQWSVQTITQKLPTIPSTPEEGCWEHPLYFVSHMFSDWSALPTFNYVAA